MAQRIVIVDDYDGTEATDNTPVKSIPFSVNEDSWTIDLKPENAAKFMKALKPWIEKATPFQAPPPKTSHKARNPEAEAIREWAKTPSGEATLKANGITLADRGRIPEDVTALYEANKPPPIEPEKAADNSEGKAEDS